MTVLRVVGLAVGWGVALLWTTRGVAWLRGMSRLPDLLQEGPQPVSGTVTAPVSAAVSVIVPARNEARDVDGCLRSLLASKGVELEVIAVDDRSTDETGAVMDALRAPPGARYAVEHVRELLAGWLGKPHAMARGAALATGEWLLFTDADVVFAEDTLARALGWLEREGGDHLLVVPTVVTRSAGEAMMLPFLHVLSIWGPRLWRVRDPQAGDAIGVGAFNLMRRAVYEKVGGWERLRMEVIEDVRMGYLVKHAGFASRVVTGRNLVRIRWARGARGVVGNLTKNVFAAFRFRIGLTVAGTVAAAVMCLAPFAGVVIGVWDRAWLWPSLVSVTVLAAVYWRYRRFADPGSATTVLWLLTFPAAAAVFVYAMVQSTVLTLMRGGVVWRDTFYPLAELRQHAGPLR